MKLDWLTLNVYAVSDFAENYSHSIVEIERHLGCRFKGRHYIHGRECITLVWTGAMITLENQQSVIEIAAHLVQNYHATCSRLDVAFDFEVSLDWLALDAANIESGVKCPARFGTPEKGFTVGAGRRGHRLVRVYDKAKQLGLELERVRVEIEFSGRRAGDALGRLALGGDTAWLWREIYKTMPALSVWSLDGLDCVPAPEKKRVKRLTSREYLAKSEHRIAQAIAENPDFMLSVFARFTSSFQYVDALDTLVTSLKNVAMGNVEKDDIVCYIANSCASLANVSVEIFEQRERLELMLRFLRDFSKPG